MRSTIFKGTSGLNTKTDPKRMKFDAETFIVELSASENIDIDHTYQPSVRGGRTLLSATASHSCFYDGGDCFLVQDRTSDAAIMRLLADKTTLEGVRSNLTKGRYVSFWQLGDKTYYMNGTTNGVIFEGLSSPWPDTSGHVGANTTRQFYPAPVGTHFGYFKGCWWIAVDDTIYVGEPYAIGKFDMARRYFNFGGDKVRMVRPVENGVWVSTDKRTGFIETADKFEQMTWYKKSSFPAHEWSVNCRLVNLEESIFQIPGLSAVWSSDEGLCIGSETGKLTVVTKEKLIYPTGAMGASVVDNDMNVINTIY